MAAATRADRTPLVPWWTKVTALVGLLMLLGGLLTFTFKASAFVEVQDEQGTRIEKLEVRTAKYDELDKMQGTQLEILKRIDAHMNKLDADIDNLREDTAALCASQRARCPRR